jgi:hypothetical protein
MAPLKTRSMLRKVKHAKIPRTKRPILGIRSTDPIVTARLAFAFKTLRENGLLAGARTKRLSARVDLGLIKAARIKTGLENYSDLINAALAVIAAPADFGPWFATQASRLSRDFEPEL